VGVRLLQVRDECPVGFNQGLRKVSASVLIDARGWDDAETGVYIPDTRTGIGQEACPTWLSTPQKLK
jgi:hypothetical protein